MPWNGWAGTEPAQPRMACHAERDLPVSAEQFEIPLRPDAGRAFVGRFRATVDVAAAEAFPRGFFFPVETPPGAYIIGKLPEDLFVVSLGDTDGIKGLGGAVKTFLSGSLRKPPVHGSMHVELERGR